MIAVLAYALPFGVAFLIGYVVGRTGPNRRPASRNPDPSADTPDHEHDDIDDLTRRPWPRRR